MNSLANIYTSPGLLPGISVAHVVPGLHPSSGGPSRTVVRLCDELAKMENIQVTLLSQSRFGEPLMEPCEQKVQRVILSSSCDIALTLGLPARSGLLQLLKSKTVNVFHSNGLWTPVNHWVSRFASTQNIPLVIQPRGMLEPWALAFKSLKKRLALSLYQRHDFRSAAVFIATAEQEADSIRRMGILQPIAVIPNGVDFTEIKNNSFENTENCCCLEKVRNERTVLFLSRIHPKKGLQNLITAWADVAPTGWRLKIAGPNEGGHLQEVMAKARKLNISSSVEYLGEVHGQAKADTYQRADLFVLPTFSENFGIVVTEALSHGIPVITTKGAPWADLEVFNCGWWIDIGVEPLATALRDAMALKDEERRAMGARGMKYVTRFGWDEIAQKTAQVYQWLLHQGTLPNCVLMD